MPEFESQYFLPQGKPNALLIFLHGYNNSREDMAYIYSYLSQQMPHLLIAAPEGAYASMQDPARKSWYKLSGFDSEGRRRSAETPMSEIAAIYDRAGDALAETAHKINQYIDEIQKQYGFTDSQTFLAGFSQGAMLAIWTALIRLHPLAGCFSVAGLAAANRILDSQIVSRPPMYLLHGTADEKVLFKCLPFTEDWLNKVQVPVKAQSYEGLDHTVSYAEMDFMTDIIKQSL